MSRWHRPPRRATSAALGVLLAGTAVGLSLRWVDWTWRIPVIQSLFPVIGVVAAVLLLLTLLLRHGRLAIIAALVTLLPAVLAGASLVPHMVAPRPGDEVVMSSNLEVSGADPRAIVDAVRARQVTALVLVEVTPRGWRRLAAAGLTTLLPYGVGTPRPATDGVVIRSVHPLTTLPTAPVAGRPSQPVARVTTAEGDYTLRGVHPYPPLPDLVGQWYAALLQLVQWRERQPATTPLVLAGDFNASSAHPAFRAAAATMTDAHRATGGGWVRTWPEGRHTPPFVQLDHVLVRRMQVVDAGTVVIPNTDHAAVWARLRLAGS